MIEKWHYVEHTAYYRVKKYPPHSKRGGYFFIFGQNLNLMTLTTKVVSFFLWLYSSLRDWPAGRTLLAPTGMRSGSIVGKNAGKHFQQKQVLVTAEGHFRQRLDFFQTVEQGLPVDMQLPCGQTDIIVAVDELCQRPH